RCRRGKGWAYLGLDAREGGAICWAAGERRSAARGAASMEALAQEGLDQGAKALDTGLELVFREVPEAVAERLPAEASQRAGRRFRRHAKIEAADARLREQGSS